MIGFVGLSHLGIISSIAAASKGFQVIAYDANAALCEQLSRRELPVLEPDLPELLEKSQAQIVFTSDVTKLGQCNLVYISVDVPTDANNRSNLTVLHQLVETIAPSLAPGTVLVILSQVPPGFTRKLAAQLQETQGDRRLQVYYQVETLIFGRAVERALYPERYIVGCPNPAQPLPQPLHELLSAFGCPLLPMRYESAELAKISINMCLVASVSVANTLAEICESIGAEWAEIVPALKLDKRIGAYSYLSPGLGISGGNLERDLITVKNLAHEWGTDAGVVDAWIANSRYRRDWVLRTLHTEVMSRVKNPTIAVWGLAYKPNTHSTKNSPSLALLEALTEFSVQAYDPQVVLSDRPSTLTQSETALAACQGADVLVVMTPWAEFSAIDLSQVKAALKGATIIDPFAALDAQKCREAGFSYFRLGSTPEQ